MTRPRIGLVLGAGGVVGHAFHAGVLAALEEAGWDGRGADVVVGTSAGSVVGALLRAGLRGRDLAARALGEPLSAEAQDRLRAAGAGPAPRLPSRPPPRAGLPRSAAPALLVRAALRPWGVRPGVLAAAALPAGRVPAAMIGDGLRALHRDGWPERPLWVCALRLDDGRRVVFGRDATPAADVPTAVAASCAIPGFFTPVPIDGARYVDGGAHSLTNLDLLAGYPLDLVVVSSPMSVAGRRPRVAFDEGPRRLARLALVREAAAVRRRGTRVLAFQPTPADLAVMGGNAMDPDRRAPVTRAALDSARRRLARPDAREALDVLLARG